jgi:hypothetical protein
MSSNLSMKLVALAAAGAALLSISTSQVFAAPAKKAVKAPAKIAQKAVSKDEKSSKTAETTDKGTDKMLSSKEAVALITSPGLKSLNKKTDVPEAVANLIPGFKSMSEPGGDFEAGCVGPGPHTRMILAATRGNKIIVAHESGGIAHWYKVEIFEQTGKDAKRIYSSFVGAPVENLATLQDAAQKGKIQG